MQTAWRWLHVYVHKSLVAEGTQLKHVDNRSVGENVCNIHLDLISSTGASFARLGKHTTLDG